MIQYNYFSSVNVKKNSKTTTEYAKFSLCNHKNGTFLTFLSGLSGILSANKNWQRDGKTLAGIDCLGQVYYIFEFE